MFDFTEKLAWRILENHHFINKSKPCAHFHEKYQEQMKKPNSWKLCLLVALEILII